MLYQSSQSTADGVMTLTVTFRLGSDVDKAQVQVQNRVAQARLDCPRRSSDSVSRPTKHPLISRWWCI